MLVLRFLSQFASLEIFRMNQEIYGTCSGGFTISFRYEIIDAEKTWPAMKPQTPFGQLPFIEDGDVKVRIVIFANLGS